MAKIERKVEKDGINYVSHIKCRTIAGMQHDELLTVIGVDEPTVMFIGTMFGMYAVKIEDLADIAKVALEEANKGV